MQIVDLFVSGLKKQFPETEWELKEIKKGKYKILSKEEKKGDFNHENEIVISIKKFYVLKKNR